MLVDMKNGKFLGNFRENSRVAERVSEFLNCALEFLIVSITALTGGELKSVLNYFLLIFYRAIIETKSRIYFF